MPGMVKWCVVSLLVHIGVMGLLVAITEHSVIPNAPVTIDLTLESPMDAGVAVNSRSGPEAVHKTVVAPLPSKVKKKEKILEKVVPSPKSPVWKSVSPAVVARVPAAQPGPSEAGGSAISAGAAAAREASRDTAVSPPVPGTGESPVSPEKAKNRYLKEHFAYIRDLIMKRLSYPLQARKMGWSGKVVISFVIMEDGSATDIRVIEGSGHTLLDRSAVETVKNAAPFPKPPIRAEIVMPILFRLT